MNYKYMKRPIVVEAFQMTKERRADNRDWPEWLNRAWQYGAGVGGAWPENYPDSDGTDRICIGNPQGADIVEWDSWIVKYGDGNLYVCKPDSFDANYTRIMG